MRREIRATLERITHLPKFAYALPLVGMLACKVDKVSLVDKVSFEDTVNPVTRQAFLDQNKPDRSECARRIVYIDEIRLYVGEGLESEEFRVFQFLRKSGYSDEEATDLIVKSALLRRYDLKDGIVSGGKTFLSDSGQKPTVVVYRGAFSYDEPVLVRTTEHELDHACDATNGIDGIPFSVIQQANPELANALLEVRAYGRDLESMSSTDIGFDTASNKFLTNLVVVMTIVVDALQNGSLPNDILLLAVSSIPPENTRCVKVLGKINETNDPTELTTDLSTSDN